MESSRSRSKRNNNNGSSQMPSPMAVSVVSAYKQPPILVEMQKLDILIIGPSDSGKSTMLNAFAYNEEQKKEEDPLHVQVGMHVTSQPYQIGLGAMEQVVKLSFWDPAMSEITADMTQDQSLIGINEQLRVRYQKDLHFHGVLVCYDCTDSNSFTQAVTLYKELMSDPEDPKKFSRYSKIPVGFVGTKVDETDFLKTDESALPRCVKIDEVRLWLSKVHRRADNACFETSARENIGVSMMVDWIVRSALRVHPAVEKAKTKQCERFKKGQLSIAQFGGLTRLLVSTGQMPQEGEEVDEQVTAAINKKNEQKWQRYLRMEAQSSVHMGDVCSIQ